MSSGPDSAPVEGAAIQQGDAAATPAALSAEEAMLLDKYDRERAKRIRADGTAQYQKSEGELARFFLGDPGAEALADRLAVDEEVDVVVVGGGWSGILTSARLVQAGVTNLRIIESGGGFGGVWYWNRYPGARCDVESYIYIPLLEETGFVPAEKYAAGPEIRAQVEAVATRFGLHSKALFQTRVTEVRWDDSAARWIASTSRGDKIRARFAFVGNGQLNYPKLPAIPGVADFKGHSFHSSRWDYAYTGGDEKGNLVNLADKRVALIGTGCTGVQCAPPLARSAKQLYVVQRTPTVIAPRDNQATDPDWAAKLEPGWQKARMANFEQVLMGRDTENLIRDEWTRFWEAPPMPEPGADPAAAAAGALKMDLAKMKEMRARIDSIVHDPETADSLKPYYYRFCKRPTFSDEYLQTFNRPNVTLIDTRGQGLDRITESAIVFDGQAYEVDCIIYATGFDVVTTSHKEGGVEIVGRGGQSIDDKWSDAVRSLHGMYTRGFPNLFFLMGARQSAPTLNFPYMMDEQALHAAAVVSRLLRDGIRVMEVSQEAEDRWCATITAKSTANLDYFRACTPSLLNGEGNLKDAGKLILTTAYGGGPFEYIEILSDWREHAMTEDLELTH